MENGNGPTGIARIDTALQRGSAYAGEGVALSRRGFVAAAFSVVAACALPAFLTGCSSGQSGSGASQGRVYSEDEIQSTTLFLFDTVIQISAACSADLMNQVSQRLEYFEGKFSRTVEGGDVWNVNHALGAPTQVASETAACISKALEFAEESNGLFDTPMTRSCPRRSRSLAWPILPLGISIRRAGF